MFTLLDSLQHHCVCWGSYRIRNTTVERLALMEMGITDSLIFVIFFVFRYTCLFKYI